MDTASSRTADAAFARVLGAEREARESVAQARNQVAMLAENARADARAKGERTERRVRAVVAAFERDTLVRLSEIAAEASRLDMPAPLDETELQALQVAVAALARERVGARS